jgi:hypothetical protein
MLERELRTAQAFTNSSGKLPILGKREWRTMLGASPDRLDSIAMALGVDGPLDIASLPHAPGSNWAWPVF